MRNAEGGSLQRRTNDDKKHCDEHSEAATSLLAEDERKDTAGETAKIVDRHDDALQARRRVSELSEPVLITDNTRENTLEEKLLGFKEVLKLSIAYLVVTKQDKCQLTSQRNCGTELEAPTKRVQLWKVPHHRY